MKLTKFSQRNLNVILNFLLYADIEDKYTQAAHNYISEDHVDGEASEEAKLERALESELIHEECFLGGDTKESNPCSIYADENTIMYAVSNITGELEGVYKLTKPQEVIEVEYREEILKSCLCSFTDEDSVSLCDIFIQGKYMEKI
jgi:hypothetical protein